MYGDGMGQPQVVGTPRSQDLARLIGSPFDDSDDVIWHAITEASVPALLMSMVHMTGEMDLLAQLPKPFKLIAMDLQGAMSEADKETGTASPKSPRTGSPPSTACTAEPMC
jgi:4-hydroxyacetophenone monooxygenase